MEWEYPDAVQGEFPIPRHVYDFRVSGALATCCSSGLTNVISPLYRDISKTTKWFQVLWRHCIQKERLKLGPHLDTLITVSFTKSTLQTVLMRSWRMNDLPFYHPAGREELLLQEFQDHWLPSVLPRALGPTAPPLVPTLHRRSKTGSSCCRSSFAGINSWPWPAFRLPSR